MVRIAYAAASIAAAALVAIVTPADAQPRRVQVGTLACVALVEHRTGRRLADAM